jgi:hypothetical protein
MVLNPFLICGKDGFQVHNSIEDFSVVG